MVSTNLSVAQILAKLEERIAHHKAQVAFHDEQEAHHQEQSALHTAELEKVVRHFEAFKGMALPAAALIQEVLAASVEEEQEDEDLPAEGRVVASRLIQRAVERIPEGEIFGATRIAQEMNDRYGERLTRPVDSRLVSVTLRRLRDAGYLEQVRAGKAAHEALYRR